jgi:hypothetical protein
MFEVITERYKDTEFVAATADKLSTQTWYLARLRDDADYIQDEGTFMPRPWKAVRVDRSRYTFFQGTLYPDRYGSETLDTFMMASQSSVRIGPSMTEAEVRDWLRDYNRVRDEAKAALV